MATLVSYLATVILERSEHNACPFTRDELYRFILADGIETKAECHAWAFNRFGF